MPRPDQPQDESAAEETRRTFIRRLVEQRLVDPLGHRGKTLSISYGHQASSHHHFQAETFDPKDHPVVAIKGVRISDFNGNLYHFCCRPNLIRSPF